MTVWVADAHVQRLVSVVKMAACLRVHYQRTVFIVLFCRRKSSMHGISKKEMFAGHGWKYLSHKAVHNSSQKRGKRFGDDEEVKMEVRSG
jgi:hypothetical protein